MNPVKYKTISLLFAAAVMAACNKTEQLRPQPLPDTPTQEPATTPQMPPMRGTGTLSPRETDSFSFVAFGDSHGEKGHPTLKAIFEDMQTVTLKPSFALSLGDIIHGEPSATDDFTTQVEKHLGDALELNKLAGIPVFNAPGNHEMDDWIADEEKPSERMQVAYERIVGPTYGSFDYGNSHFIILNTEDVPPPGMEGPSPEQLKAGMEFSYLGKDQLAWLQSDMDANKHKQHIFISMHYPIHAQHPERDNLFGESRSALINLFKKYSNISFVIASHEHQYYNSLDPENHETVAPFTTGNPTQYLISGGAGASMEYFPLPGGFHHYLLFEVDGESVSVTIKKIPPAAAN